MTRAQGCTGWYPLQRSGAKIPAMGQTSGKTKVTSQAPLPSRLHTGAVRPSVDPKSQGVGVGAR